MRFARAPVAPEALQRRLHRIQVDRPDQRQLTETGRSKAPPVLAQLRRCGLAHLRFGFLKTAHFAHVAQRENLTRPVHLGQDVAGDIDGICADVLQAGQHGALVAFKVRIGKPRCAQQLADKLEHARRVARRKIKRHCRRPHTRSEGDARVQRQHSVFDLHRVHRRPAQRRAFSSALGKQWPGHRGQHIAAMKRLLGAPAQAQGSHHPLVFRGARQHGDVQAGFVGNRQTPALNALGDQRGCDFEIVEVLCRYQGLCQRRICVESHQIRSGRYFRRRGWHARAQWQIGACCPVRRHQVLPCQGAHLVGSDVLQSVADADDQPPVAQRHHVAQRLCGRLGITQAGAPVLQQHGPRGFNFSVARLCGFHHPRQGRCA